MNRNLFYSIIGGISIIAVGTPVCNYYLLPSVRHKELMDKLDLLLKKIEKDKKG